jgi:hypothetical protein
VLVDVFVELPTNNLENSAMPFRMSRKLKFWIEVKCELQDLRRADDKEIAAILQVFEQRGDAMRSLRARQETTASRDWFDGAIV